jgi:threonine synthase
LFDLYGRDGAKIDELMRDFQQGPITLDDNALSGARELFASQRVDDVTTCQTIFDVFEKNEYLLDPHSAIGLKAARDTRNDLQTPMVTLATAHPAKFPAAVAKAGVEVAPELPYHLRDLMEREERFDVVANDIKAVQSFIAERL